ncbi:MAG: hypothetical protein ACI4MS_07750 [Candidatus Coproplasma sp.]
MKKPPATNGEILFLLGIIALLAICPPLGVIAFFILIFSAK